jgi:2-dehydropantoate 2-reductase
MATASDIKKLAGSIDTGVVFVGKQKPLKHLKMVVVGAGVIGGSVGAWIAEKYDNIYFHDLPENNELMRKGGITTFPQGKKDKAVRVGVKVLDNLSEAADADVVIIGVKNYSLDTVAKRVKEAVGDRPVIVGMQNGRDNQEILPKYFTKVVYCVISYNAWTDGPMLIGYQKKGPLHLGTRHNELQQELDEIARIFNLGVETHVTQALGDAVHSKLVINLTNSLTTLVGMSFKPISDMAIFQKLLSNLLWEGVQIVKAAGFRESRLGGMPPWRMLWMSTKLPRAVTKGLFARNVKKMVISSMAQDVIQRACGDSELDSLNGYLLNLAAKHRVDAPYNRAIYDLCKREFCKPAFEPLDVKTVWEEVQKRVRS